MSLNIAVSNVVYIRKVKKSESKSQRGMSKSLSKTVVYIRKVKKSESKSQQPLAVGDVTARCVYP